MPLKPEIGEALLRIIYWTIDKINKGLLAFISFIPSADRRLTDWATKLLQLMLRHRAISLAILIALPILLFILGEGGLLEPLSDALDMFTDLGGPGHRLPHVPGPGRLCRSLPAGFLCRFGPPVVPDGSGRRYYDSPPVHTSEGRPPEPAPNAGHRNDCRGPGSISGNSQGIRDGAPPYLLYRVISVSTPRRVILEGSRGPSPLRKAGPTFEARSFAGRQAERERPGL